MKLSTRQGEGVKRIDLGDVDVDFLLQPSAIPIGVLHEKQTQMLLRRERREEARALSRSRGEDIYYGHRSSVSQRIGQSRQSGVVTLSGRFLDIWVSPELLHTGFCCFSGGSGGGKGIETAEMIAQRINHRARKNIRRIVNANDFQGMITLTLAPPSEENDKSWKTTPYESQKDYDFVRNMFHRYKAGLRHQLGSNLRYLVVFELHDSERTSSEKRGTWHLHMAIPADYSVAGGIMQAWKHGRCDYQDFRRDKSGKIREKEIANPGAYISEYIGKEGAQFGASDLMYKKRYSCSRNCLRPRSEWIRGGEIEALSENEISYKNKRYRCTYFRKDEKGVARGSYSASYVEVSK